MVEVVGSILLNSIKNKLNVGYINEYPSKNIMMYYWRITSRHELEFIYNYLYHDNFCLQRKYNKFTELLNL
jgi:hypothetical protein